jgi:hypothetical protein
VGLALQNAALLVARKGALLIVLQLPSVEEQAVAATRYSYIQTLKSHFALIDKDEVQSLLRSKGFEVVAQENRFATRRQGTVDRHIRPEFVTSCGWQALAIQESLGNESRDPELRCRTEGCAACACGRTNDRVPPRLHPAFYTAIYSSVVITAAKRDCIITPEHRANLGCTSWRPRNFAHETAPDPSERNSHCKSVCTACRMVESLQCVI